MKIMCISTSAKPSQRRNPAKRLRIALVVHVALKAQFAHRLLGQEEQGIVQEGEILHGRNYKFNPSNSWYITI